MRPLQLENGWAVCLGPEPVMAVPHIILLVLFLQVLLQLVLLLGRIGCGSLPTPLWRRVVSP